MKARREESYRQLLENDISVEILSENEAAFLCPNRFADKLHAFLVGKRISVSLPKQVGNEAPDSELLVHCTKAEAYALIKDFITELSLKDLYEHYR